MIASTPEQEAALDRATGTLGGRVIRYEEARPSGVLGVYVEAYWHFQVESAAAPFEHTVPLTGGTVLTCMPARGLVVLTGPRAVPLRPLVQPGDVYCGAMFHPGVGAALFGTTGEALRDRQFMAADWVGTGWTAALLDDLHDAATPGGSAARLDAGLKRLFARASPLDPEVVRAASAICESHGTLRIESVLRASGLPERTFRRRFRAGVGLTAKELARIRRLHAVAVDSLQEPRTPWSSLAAARGFADQPHLVNEFRQLTGSTPAEFAGYVRSIQHGSLAVGRFPQDGRGSGE